MDQIQTIPKGCDGAAGSLAPWFGPPQYLGSDAARHVLEIRAATEDRRRQTRLVCAEREQFFLASRKGQAPRGRHGPRNKKLLERETSGLAGSSGEVLRTSRGAKFMRSSTAWRSTTSITRPNPPAPAVDGALIKTFCVRNVLTRTRGLGRPGKGGWPQSLKLRRIGREPRTPG